MGSLQEYRHFSSYFLTQGGMSGPRRALKKGPETAEARLEKKNTHTHAAK